MFSRLTSVHLGGLISLGVSVETDHLLLGEMRRAQSQATFPTGRGVGLRPTGLPRPSLGKSPRTSWACSLGLAYRPQADRLGWHVGCINIKLQL